MAQSICPDCSALIPEVARKCLNCGCLLHREAPAKPDHDLLADMDEIYGPPPDSASSRRRVSPQEAADDIAHDFLASMSVVYGPPPARKKSRSKKKALIAAGMITVTAAAGFSIHEMLMEPTVYGPPPAPTSATAAPTASPTAGPTPEPTAVPEDKSAGDSSAAPEEVSR